MSGPEFTSYYSEGESEYDFGSWRDGCGSGGRCSRVRASSMDDEPEDGDYEARGRGRDARGGVRSRRHGRDFSEENDSDGSEDGGVQGRPRAARGYGGSSRR